MHNDIGSGTIAPITTEPVDLTATTKINMSTDSRIIGTTHPSAIDMSSTESVTPEVIIITIIIDSTLHTDINYSNYYCPCTLNNITNTV